MRISKVCIAREFDIATTSQLFAVSSAADIYRAFPVSNSGIEFLIVDYRLNIELHIWIAGGLRISSDDSPLSK